MSASIAVLHPALATGAPVGEPLAPKVGDTVGAFVQASNCVLIVPINAFVSLNSCVLMSGAATSLSF